MVTTNRGSAATSEAGQSVSQTEVVVFIVCLCCLFMLILFKLLLRMDGLHIVTVQCCLFL